MLPCKDAYGVILRPPKQPESKDAVEAGVRTNISSGLGIMEKKMEATMGIGFGFQGLCSLDYS